jgi:hypothetical protein
VVLLVGAALTAGAVDYFWIDIFGGVFPITSTWRYRQTLAWLHGSQYPTNSDVLEFFPKTIPANASNTEMELWTPAGDLSFQLHYTLPATDLAALMARVAPTAMVTAHGGDQLMSVLSTHNEFMDTQFFVGGIRTISDIPTTSTIYITNVGYSKIAPGMECMYQSGIVIDPVTNSVIYWLEGHDSDFSFPHATRAK